MKHHRCGILRKLKTAIAIAIAFWVSPALAQLSPSMNFQPVLDLNFLTATTLSSTLTLTRASSGYYFNAGGTLTSVASNIPRFDHDPATGLRKGLLMEPAATNLLAYSESHSSGNWWVLGTATLAYNNAVGPDGTTTATRFTDQVSGADQHGIGFNINVASFTDNTNYTFSVFLKAGSTSLLEIYGYNKSNTTCSYRVFLTGTGTITATGADAGDNGICSNKVITQLANGWYRVQFAMNVQTGAVWPGCMVRLTDGTASWYAGDGTHNAYVWGGQVELGTTASSYIKTTGSSATRAVDTLSSTVGTWLSPKTGTLRAQYVNLDDTVGAAHLFSLSSTGAAGSFTNEAIYLADSASSDASKIRSASSTTYSGTGTVSSSGNVNRLALTYTPSSYASSGNGSAATTATTGNLPAVDPAFAYIASSPNGAQRPRWVQTIQYYNQRIRNEVLANLTSVPTSLTYTDSAGSAGDLSTYTFSTKAIGTAASDRWVIVGVAARAGSKKVATSVTVGGVSAILLATTNQGFDDISFWAANVTTGTTGDVVVNFDGSMSRCGVLLWTIRHSRAPSVSSSSTYNNSDFGNVMTVQPGELALGLIYANYATGQSWTGLTEDAEVDLVEIGARFSGASASFTGYSTNWSIGNSTAGGSWADRGGLAITIK